MTRLGAVLGLTILVVAVAGDVVAEGYLATRPTELEPLILGTEESGYGLSVNEYQLETGKAYSLEIASTGRKEYAFEAPEFFIFIWLRKVEAGGLEIKASHVYELEFEEEATCEIFFVPIKPGTYEYRARGLEKQGMVGRFVVR